LQDFQIFAGLRPLRLQWIDVARVVEAALDGLVPGGSPRIVRKLEVSAAIHADAGLLAHAIRNLVVNGLQASAPEGLVTIEAEEDGGMVLITVSDDGPGVPEGGRERIFDPLFTTKSSGSGLGLTIVQRVAEAHGATVELRDRPEGGAVFVLRWPREAAGE
jgi:signal transduction histidine kinase